MALRLNLGSAGRVLAGYKQVDLNRGPGVDLVADISSLDGIPDNSVIEIWASHSFEYFDRKEAPAVLSEWFRVLIPSQGILRLSVPAFESLIEIYSLTKNLNTVIGPLFGRWENPDGSVQYHRTVWDEPSLRQALENAGFEDIKVFKAEEYLENTDPDFDDYSLAFFPHMDRKGIRVSLSLSARKP